MGEVSACANCALQGRVADAAYCEHCYVATGGAPSLAMVREFVAWAREQGAVHVKAGDYEVTFAPAAAAAQEPADPTAEQQAIAAEQFRYGSGSL